MPLNSLAFSAFLSSCARWWIPNLLWIARILLCHCFSCQLIRQLSHFIAFFATFRFVCDFSSESWNRHMPTMLFPGYANVIHILRIYCTTVNSSLPVAISFMYPWFVCVCIAMCCILWMRYLMWMGKNHAQFISNRSIPKLIALIRIFSLSHCLSGGACLLNLCCCHRRCHAMSNRENIHRAHSI